MESLRTYIIIVVVTIGSEHEELVAGDGKRLSTHRVLA